MNDENWTSSFEDVEREQLRFWMRATPSQKLQWLEDALKFAYAAGALPRKEDDRTE